MLKPKWIFFDMGSTLIDESKAYARRMKEMLENTNVTEAQYNTVRLEYARQGYYGDAKAREQFGLIRPPWHSEDESPFEEAEYTLSVLQSRKYRLGVIANQFPGAAARLERWGLKQYFDVLALSDELGISKPNPDIFLWAMGQAGCHGREAVMVGDRPDNDLGPAKMLGMTTVRVMKGRAVFQAPRSGEEKPDYSIASVKGLLDVLP